MQGTNTKKAWGGGWTWAFTTDPAARSEGGAEGGGPSCWEEGQSPEVLPQWTDLGGSSTRVPLKSVARVENPKSHLGM